MLQTPSESVKSYTSSNLTINFNILIILNRKVLLSEDILDLSPSNL